MRISRLAPAGLAVGLLLSACQTTDMASTSSGTSATPASNAVPLSQPITVAETSDSNTSTRVTGNGVETRTTSTSASVSVDPNALVNVVLGAALAPTTVTPADMAGRWTLVQPDGKSCNVTLNTFGNTMGGSFFKSGCFHDQVFSAMNWELRPGQIVLTDATRNPVATMSLAGMNQAKGAGMTLYR